MRRRYDSLVLTKGAWERAIVLQCLARSGLPLTRRDLGEALLVDPTTIGKRLSELIEIGAVGVERGRDRRSRYFVAPVVRMAAA